MPQIEAPAEAAAETPAEASAEVRSATSADASVDTPAESPRDRLYRLRREVDQQDDGVQHPDDLLRIAQFREGAALLASAEFAPADIVDALGASGYSLSCMAALALRERNDVSAQAALTATMPFGGYPLRFLFDWLQAQPDARAMPWLLRHARGWWWDAPGVRQRAREYFRWALANPPPGEPEAMAFDELDDHSIQDLEAILKQFQEPALAPYLAQTGDESRRRREKQTLGGIGRVWSPSESVGSELGVAANLIVDHPELLRDLERLHELVNAPRPKSILLCGEHGSGKTILVDRLFARLHAEGWLLFEASAAEVMAGQIYTGELEARIRDLLAALDRKRALWRVQDFFDLLHKGSHKQDPRGILDLLLPAMERGRLLMLGETTPQPLAQLLLARPVLRHHAEVVTLRSPDDAAMRDVLARWANVRETALGRPPIDARALDEAQRMAAQYFPEQHEPGRTLRLLDETLRAALSDDPPRLPLDHEALLRAIASRSGLPLDVLDDRQSLDLEQLRAFFRKRVIGQDEAVECLVDRIAMLKAGLVDAARPIGVFLFAGPTGTGKTELAKTLGELLFGSSERLLRLDMSEYQSDDAAWRLTDDGGDGSARSLTARIREQPFSVVLLDEFEKAHPKVWDLFLQVFDDGRLSDRSGHVADFRHSIIILTSNVGSTLARNAGPGFTSVAGGYSRGAVEKALFETFRREFLNRLDRIVLFNPLDRTLMREILHKELQRAMERRGLRNKDWAVEWEPSAIEFLLDRGFTPDLGARPVRRAIEQHLLAPLARGIVEHRTPQGDQFLFVRSAGDRLEVEFVDPNMPATASIATRTAPRDGDLRTLVYAPDASADAIEDLRAAFARLADALDASMWSEARDADYARMNERDFWSQANRFEVLDRIERRHRIESAFETARRLDERLARDGTDAGFVARHAQLLWLSELAIDAVAQQRPQDALLWLAVSESDLKRDAAQARLWWQRLLAMYMAWAEHRNMRVEVLEQDATACRARLAAGGFGALALLEAEHGLHAFEYDTADGGTARIVASVRVSADLPGRARPARAVADVGQSEEELRVCRRYRAAPSPLVRDSVRGWRSGRYDRVLAGEFDAMPVDQD
ncbi:MAG: AAA family ATPase [Xanthomonadaceae bacterium]|nr:AAA family ATPase [Xanthomonadaceae bacterium]